MFSFLIHNFKNKWIQYQHKFCLIEVLFCFGSIREQGFEARTSLWISSCHFLWLERDSFIIKGKPRLRETDWNFSLSLHLGKKVVVWTSEILHLTFLQWYLTCNSHLISGAGSVIVPVVMNSCEIFIE